MDNRRYKMHLETHKALRYQLKNGDNSKERVKTESDSEGSEEDDQVEEELPEPSTSTVNVFIQLPESVQNFEDEDPFEPSSKSSGVAITR